MFNNVDVNCFWRNLGKIKDALLLSDSEFAAFLGIKPEAFLVSRNKNTTLPIDCLFGLAEKLNFHLEDLLLSPDFVVNYDPNANKPLLDRYVLAPHSQTRAIINILNYLELTKGTRAKTNLIRKFQLSEEFIKNENNNANVLLISDILKYLGRNHNFKSTDYLDIGHRLPFIENNNILKEKLTDHKTAFDILECFVYECTRLFDTNCTYTISESSNDYAVIDVQPNRDVVDELKLENDQFGNEELCLTKMGNFASTFHFKYGKNASIKKINSIHSGHLTNQYIIDLSVFNNMDKTSSFSKYPTLNLVH